MMTPNEYWSWFQLDFYYRLMISISLIIVFGGGYFIWFKLTEWYESRESKDQSLELFKKL